MRAFDMFYDYTIEDGAFLCAYVWGEVAPFGVHRHLVYLTKKV